MSGISPYFECDSLCVALLIYLAFSWTLKNLAAAIGAPVDVLSRRIHFWISKVSFIKIHGDVFTWF